MALQLRPSCEQCATALPPDSTDAMICSYECTFCRTCVDDVLLGVCPNCGGGFSPRPVRSATEWVPGVSLAVYPASTKEIVKPVDPATHRKFATRVKRG
jgi:uncharacterized protein